jgi:hypothetical protein
MFGKLVLLGSVVAASLLVASSAQAQECGAAFIQEGGGNAGWILCIPIEAYYPQQPVPEG